MAEKDPLQDFMMLINRLEDRMREQQDAVLRLKASLDRMDTSLRWHSFIAAAVAAILTPVLGWLIVTLYDLNGSVSEMKPLIGLLDTVVGKLIE